MDRSAAMLVLFMFLFGMLMFTLAMFAYMPIFTSLILSLIYVLYQVMKNEKSGVLSTQEHENRFWTIFWLVVSTVVCFAKDSPCAIGLWSPSVGFLFVIGCGVLVNIYDRHQHRVHVSRSHASLKFQHDSISVTSDSLQSNSSSLTSNTYANDSISFLSKSNLRRRVGTYDDPSAISVSSASNTVGSFDSISTAHYNQLLIKIDKALQEIDGLLLPSTIKKLVRRQHILKSEKCILHIMGGVAGNGLNYILARVKLPLIIYKIKDHQSSPTEHNRTSLIELLAVQRIGVLNTISRVHLLHALQALRLSANKRGEYWVRNIILKTHGENLTMLKTLIDSRGDYHSMNKLIFEDIRSETVREDILQHFLKQPSIMHRKILSDVDDTLICSGGVWPAGVDRRFSRKAMYPGVTSFYLELDSGLKGNVGNLIFLSARPHFYKDWAEIHSFEKFKKMVEKGKMHCIPSLLTGDVKSGTEFIVKNNYEPLAKKKYRNFVDYVSIFPEFKHIFIGDNGQGDFKSALYMMAAYPRHLQAVYIHLVQPLPETHGYREWFYSKDEQLDDSNDENDAASVSSLQSEQSSRKPLTITPIYKPINRSKSSIPRQLTSRTPLHFFRTYVDAALHAYEHELFDIHKLINVCHNAIIDFSEIEKWPSSGSNRQIREKRGIELNNDLWKVNVRLQELYKSNDLPSDIQPLQNENVTLEPRFVHFLNFEQKWMYGEMVCTPYGRGRVLDGYDPVWDIYNVALDWRPLDVQVKEHSNNFSGSSEKRPTAMAQAKNTKENSQPSTPRPYQDSSKDIIRDIQDTATLDEELHSSANGSESIPEDLISLSDQKSGTKCQEEAVETSISPMNTPTCSSHDTLAVPNSPHFFGQSQSENFIKARICGHNILPYTPPTYKSYEKQNSRILFFKGKSTKQDKSEDIIKKQISTPYGKGIIVSIGGTVCIQLSYGILYSTQELVDKWTQSNNSGTLLSSLSSLVSKHLKPTGKNELPIPTLGRHTTSSDSILFEQYFRDGASVITTYGEGRVSAFNESTGIYSVVLEWPQGAEKATVYMMKSGISAWYSSEYKINDPILVKSLKLRGILEEIIPETGVHVVRMEDINMKCFVANPNNLMGALALDGDEVNTVYGIGKVINYSVTNDMYTIKLSWGILYSSSLERVNVRAKKGQQNSWGVLNFLLGK